MCSGVNGFVLQPKPRILARYARLLDRGKLPRRSPAAVRAARRRAMRGFLAGVDKLLRGGYTQGADLAYGRVPVNEKILVVAGVVLGGFYGAFMGLYSLMRGGAWAALQVLATMAKV